jgi:hypothetical protein
LAARVIEALLPVMHELGLVTIFEDLNFGNVQDLFDENEIRSIKTTFAVPTNF